MEIKKITINDWLRSLEENLQNLKVLAKILALINRLLLVY